MYTSVPGVALGTWSAYLLEAQRNVARAYADGQIGSNDSNKGGGAVKAPGIYGDVAASKKIPGG